MLSFSRRISLARSDRTRTPERSGFTLATPLFLLVASLDGVVFLRVTPRMRSFVMRTVVWG